MFNWLSSIQVFQFKLKVTQNMLVWMIFEFIQLKSSIPFPREDNSNKVKIKLVKYSSWETVAESQSYL